jgi:hypothetical protein
LKFAELFNILLDVDHILIFGSNESIIGYQLLIPKKIIYQSVSYSVCGMSYMAVSPQYQNSEASILLKKLTLKRIKDFDLSIGFARKVMDNYWRPFGFVGVTNFNILNIDFKKIPISLMPHFEFRGIESADMNIVKSINQLSSLNQWFEFLRTDQDWNLWKYKITDAALTPLVILRGAEIVGYIIISTDVVIEFEVKPEFQKHSLKIIKNFCSQSNMAGIKLQIPLNSAIVAELRKESHEVNCRFVYEGGHFIKANNLAALLIKSTPIFEGRLRILGIKDAFFDFDNFKFTMQKGELKICENGSGKISNEWKLLMLMGVDGMLHNYFYSNEFFPILRVIMPVLHPQFKYLDQV